MSVTLLFLSSEMKIDFREWEGYGHCNVDKLANLLWQAILSLFGFRKDAKQFLSLFSVCHSIERPMQQII